MDSQSLTNCLAVLREMTNGEVSSDSGEAVIKRLAGKVNLSDNVTLRLADHLLEQINLAVVVIRNSPMRAEAKAGVAQVLNGMSSAFSLQGLRAPWNRYVQNLTGSISNLVILLDAANVEERSEIPVEASELILDLEDTLQKVNDPALDSVVRDIAAKHLTILATLLRHIPVFGLEGALTGYFELMARVRRAEVGASPEAKEKFAPIWVKMTKWSERLGTIDKIWNAGAKIVEHADKASGLLTYLPMH